MICRYCGLETGAGPGHCSQTECIRALNAEIEKAKRLIGQAREPVADRRTTAAGHATSAGRPEGACIEPA